MEINQYYGHIKTHKLPYFGHKIRNKRDIVKGPVMTGLAEDTRKHGRPKISWLDNATMWSGLSGSDLLHTLQNRKQWKRSLTHMHSQPRLGDYG